MSGTIRNDSTYVGGTASSQAVCQIPVTGVYQIPFGLETCFPPRLISLVRRIENADDEFLFAAGLQCVGHVQRERVITAAVGADFLPVDPDGGLPIDRAEVQQDASCQSNRREF